MPRLLVTAFGPFDGRLENASSLALRALKRRRPGIRTRIFPVDAVAAPARLRRALHELQPDAVILLGEAAGSTTLRLETTAWNRLDFTIPDIRGRQPTPREIIPGAPEKLASTLPLERFHTRLSDAGHPVAFSDDPGRYLCNQLFFTARWFFESRGRSCPAGFIHLPLADTLPTHRAVEMLTCLLDELESSAHSPTP